MFSLNEADAFFEHMNTRTQKAGDEDEPAVDLKFVVAMSNDVLEEFEPGLKAALYASAPGAVDDMHSPGHRPKLRFREIEQPIRLKSQLIGAKLRIHWGVSGEGHIDLTCDVNAFRAECEDGGTVRVTFRVQCQPEDEDAGRLYGMQKETLTITLTPPSADEMAAEIRAREAKRKSAAPAPASDDNQGELSVDDELLGEERAQAISQLAEAGYQITEGEMANWTDDDVYQAVEYCEQLGKVGAGTAPKVPPILRGRFRNGTPTQVH